jgi:ketosteroid isomerase-like protein
MSERDVDVVRDQFEAVNERDFERAMSLYAEDVVLVATWGLDSGTYEGKEAVGRWFGNWFKAFASDYHFEVDEAREIGDAILLNARHGGRGRSSGAEVSGENAYLYWVRDGKVSRVEMYERREDALRAARASR